MDLLPLLPFLFENFEEQFAQSPKSQVAIISIIIFLITQLETSWANIFIFIEFTFVLENQARLGSSLL